MIDILLASYMMVHEQWSHTSDTPNVRYGHQNLRVIPVGFMTMVGN